MQSFEHTYEHDTKTLRAHVAHFPTVDEEKLPAVLIAHDWSGRNDFAREKAEQLAALGFVGFALDMYGEGQTAEAVEDKMALMQPLLNDRALLTARMQASLRAVRELPFVDAERIAVIGFCFGGLCALDLARSSADVAGVVSFHGLLHKPQNLPVRPITAKVLAFHGYDDPMVHPEDVVAFCEEMTEAGADWQMHMYGNTRHSFMNPLAHNEEMGTVYSEAAERRSLAGLVYFLRELFAS